MYRHLKSTDRSTTSARAFRWRGWALTNALSASVTVTDAWISDPLWRTLAWITITMSALWCLPTILRWFTSADIQEITGELTALTDDAQLRTWAAAALHDRAHLHFRRRVTLLCVVLIGWGMLTATVQPQPELRGVLSFADLLACNGGLLYISRWLHIVNRAEVVRARIALNALRDASPPDT